MNTVSIIPAPVAAQISGPGSFFGSCQIASGNFEDLLSSMSEDIIHNIIPDIMSELPTTNCDSENLMEQPVPLDTAPLNFTFQDFGKSEVLMQLQQILGEDAGTEAYEHIINLLEKGTLSVQADTINWDKDTFEKLTISLLERLDLAIKQITKAPSDSQDGEIQNSTVQKYEYENEDNSDMEKFLNLLTDLLKTGMITPQEYETALKNPEDSSLPELLGELKKEAVKLIENLENVENVESIKPEQVAKTWHTEEPSQVEKPEQTEQPRHVEQPKQTERPRHVEEPRQVKPLWQTEQPKQTEQFSPGEQPRQTERPIQTEHYGPADAPKQTEQPRQVEQPQQTEAFSPVEQFLHTEKPILAKQFLQGEQPEQVEQYAEHPKHVVHNEQNEPLLEELRVISMEMENGVNPKDKVKFYELINNLLEKGLINEQDLKNVVKMPTMENESSSFKPKFKSEKNDAGKIEPTFVRNVLEKLWTSIESENKVEKENIFSKFKEIVETKSMSNSGKIDFKQAKVEVEVRAVWDAGDLKIETVNPKTGEKLHSVPVANSHRMQERIHEFEVVRQVVAQAKFITTPKGEQRLTMQLRPEHLGQMNLRIVLNNGEMQIHARVESLTAQAALESHVGLLREGLEKQGINLDRLEVSVEQKDRQDAFSLAEKHEQHEKHGKGRDHHRNKEMHLAVSVKNDANSDTGRRLGYNTMEYLA